MSTYHFVMKPFMSSQNCFLTDLLQATVQEIRFRYAFPWLCNIVLNHIRRIKTDIAIMYTFQDEGLNEFQSAKTSEVAQEEPQEKSEGMLNIALYFSVSHSKHICDSTSQKVFFVNFCKLIISKFIDASVILFRLLKSH